MKKLVRIFARLAGVACLGFVAWLIYIHREALMDLIKDKAPTAY